jgi:3-isopropylmalate/(R)-2-methylmalate dehydratase large subunit
MVYPQTLLEKIWQRHVVSQLDDDYFLLYVDRHLLNEVTSPQAFDGLRVASRQPWRASSVLATADHNIPTTNRLAGMHNEAATRQFAALQKNCSEYALRFFELTDRRQGILHVVAPELGETLPGMTIACGDSHTTTHGAFGALAFGIGTSDVEQILATQCLVLRRPKTLNVKIRGELPRGSYAKDVALAFIGRYKTDFATGFALEFSGETVSGFSMESRMTLCNMAVEAGARCALIGVDKTVIDYLDGRPSSPVGTEWENAKQLWSTLHSDPSAEFDKTVEFDVSDLRPQVTWGTTPAMVTGIDGRVPDPAAGSTPEQRAAATRALDYMGLDAGTRIREIRLDKIFIGSCTNARIEDLRVAADIVKGRKVASMIRQALVVPGSGNVKYQAEAEGLDRIFVEAGFEWREPGCSMCLGMNNDSLGEDERCASTSNRNFEGRQGRGGRSHLVSPALAAGAAIAGHFIDPAEL